MVQERQWLESLKGSRYCDARLQGREGMVTPWNEDGQFDAIDTIGVIFALVLLIGALWLFSQAHSMMSSGDPVEKILGVFAGPGLVALGVTLLGGMGTIIVALIKRH